MKRNETQDSILILREQLRRKYRRLTPFARHAFKELEPSTLYKHGWHIDAICEVLEALFHRWIHSGIINIPPGYMKSLLCLVIFPAWIWTQKPQEKILAASYKESLVARDSRLTRKLIIGEWYQDLWGDQFDLLGDLNQVMRFGNDKGGERICTKVGTGTGEHAGTILLDDPHDALTILSDPIRNKALNWERETLASRGIGAAETIWLLIMQRLHAKDMTARWLEKGVDVHLELPATFEEARKCVIDLGRSTISDPRTKEGQALWPEMHDEEALAKQREDDDEYVWAGQKQQRPVPKGGGTIKKKHLRYWGKPNGPKMPEFSRTFQSWDVAFDKTATSSFIVGQLWGLDYPKRYLLDQVRARMSFVETYTKMISVTKEWSKEWGRPEPIWIEKKANGAAVTDQLKALLAAAGIVIKAVEPARGSKTERLAAQSGLFETGNVWVPWDAPWITDWIEEITLFPFAGADDQVDAASQALHQSELLHLSTAEDNISLPDLPQVESFWMEP